MLEWNFFHWYSFTASFHYLANSCRGYWAPPETQKWRVPMASTQACVLIVIVCLRPHCDFTPFPWLACVHYGPALHYYFITSVYSLINTIPRGSRFVGQVVAEAKSRLDSGVKNFPVTSYTVCNAELYIQFLHQRKVCILIMSSYK